MIVDVFHDTACPWCRIGKRHLALALEAWNGPDVTIRYHTFFLNATIPPEGYLFRPYMNEKGGGQIPLEQFFDAPRRAGAAVGLTFNFEAIEHAPNTLLSHRLIALASEADKPAVIDAIYAAYFEHGRNIGDLEVLVDVARACGLDGDWVRQQLSGDAMRDQVLAEAEAAAQLGVRGVPLFVFDNKFALSGAQPPAVMLRALQQTAQAIEKGNRAMILAVIGSTGKTGIHILQQALNAGHEVRALARTPSKITIQHPKLTVVQGDAYTGAGVEQVIAGADAVINALGHVKGSPQDLQVASIRNIINAMKKHGVRRLVTLTGGGVRDPKDQPKPVDRIFKLLLQVLSPAVLKDSESYSAMVRSSDLDWTLVRAPRLTDNSAKGSFKVGYVGPKSGFQLSRADLAAFMVAQASDRSYVRQSPFIAD